MFENHVLYLRWLGVAFFLCSSLSFAQPTLFETPLSPRIANYDIRVDLDVETHSLRGRQLIHWKNASDEPVSEMRFHLYMNGFRNNRSTFMLESGGVHRNSKMGEEDGWGFSEIKQIVMLPKESTADAKRYLNIQRKEEPRRVPGIDITAGMEFMQPDTPDEYDKSYFRLPLPEAVEPGETVTLFVDFTALLPEPAVARTGAMKDYVFAGQWFPKVAKFTDEGWNSHQFHLNSEFFADYGVYNVWITLPDDRIVGSTGLEVEVNQNDDGTATHYYHAEDVHDFAWTASSDYVEFRGREQDVDIRALVQKDHVAQGPRHVEAAKVAVRYFQDWYGDYPFPNLTVIDPRRGAEATGGMEYPTLITAGTSYGLMEGFRSLEHVIIHEFGHNFWYHLLASNEFEEAWLDEGINTFTEIEVMNAEYGPTGDMLDVFGIKLNTEDMHRMIYRIFPDADPVVQNAWEYYSNASYGISSYSRSGTLLSTLRNIVGKETMRKIINTYVTRWRFKHPTTQDFMDIANEVSGKNLDSFFQQALFSEKTVDYSISYVRTKKYKAPKGFDFDESLSDIDSTLDSLETPFEPDSLTKKLHFSEVRVRRLGDFTHPVEVEVTFSDGETLREQWDGKSRWKKFKYLKEAKLVEAAVDPDHVLTLDTNYANNSKMVSPPKLGLNKTSARFLFWMQFILDQPEMINWPSFFLL
ncbi:MAG: M1 family metallopeptidase [Calditrichia bacterium]